MCETLNQAEIFYFRYQKRSFQNPATDLKTVSFLILQSEKKKSILYLQQQRLRKIPQPSDWNKRAWYCWDAKQTIALYPSRVPAKRWWNHWLSTTKTFAWSCLPANIVSVWTHWGKRKPLHVLQLILLVRTTKTHAKINAHCVKPCQLLLQALLFSIWHDQSNADVQKRDTIRLFHSKEEVPSSWTEPRLDGDTSRWAS